MKYKLSKKIQNFFLRKLSYISSMPSDGNIVYLTFDDGPEPGITEFVLKELDKYGFKATFFCRGDNAEKNLELFALLREKGHTIGNHTFSHIHAYDVSAKCYEDDVNHAEEILHTQWLRPPHGSLTFGAWWRLHKKYKLVFWFSLVEMIMPVYGTAIRMQATSFAKISSSIPLSN